MGAVRINKFLTLANICSRREADLFILKGLVKINGRQARLGDKVQDKDAVFFKGKKVFPVKENVYLAFNKPRGVIVTTKNQNKNIVDYIGYPERIFPVGRLDVGSEGLIILTNDGKIVNGILKSENKLEKEYQVKVNREIEPAFILEMSRGVEIDGRKTLPAKVVKTSKNIFNIVITEGRNRQIRKMCERLNYKVRGLKRVRIGGVLLGGLASGKYRKLNSQELQGLK